MIPPRPRVSPPGARFLRTALLLAMLAHVLPVGGADADAGAGANRLTHLDDPAGPFHPNHRFPRLVTPQWVGDTGVVTVITYGIDDLSSTPAYERYLRPVLDRLRQIDGRAPVSIFCNSPDPADPRFAEWRREGLSFEVHTLSHPCPILVQGSFRAAAQTFHGGVELLNRIPGNVPVAFRTPCCDSINSPSPRLFAEIFSRTNAAGQFLRLDSSVAMVLTTNDPALPREALIDPQGRPRFQKYLPFPEFTTTIENYPYPYVHTRFIWELPFVVPSDWESQNLQGNAHPQLTADWLAALDLIVRKQGMMNYIFHPAAWSSPTQHVAFIDAAVRRHGRTLKFLNYREVEERLTRNLCAGQPLRAPDGGANGVLLLDLNHDGFLDVIIGNDQLRRTRVWQPATAQWLDSGFPTRLAATDPGRRREDLGIRFGIVGAVDQPVMLVRNEEGAGAWRFAHGAWQDEPALLAGLEIDGRPVLTSRAGVDRGVRLRDVDADGTDEIIVGNDTQNAVFRWSPDRRRWESAPYRLPAGTAVVDAAGRDRGLRFVDLNHDGLDDVLCSNDELFVASLMVPRLNLGFQPGWTREVVRGRRGQTPELPPIARGGDTVNNGAWFARDTLYVQNEDTARLPHHVDRRTFLDILGGLLAPALGPAQSLATIQVPTNFVVELVAHEPAVQDPVGLDWAPDGRLWVVEMRDYPLGLDGRGRPGGAIRVLEDRDRDGRYETSTLFATNLHFPNSLMPWRNGVLISMAPDIVYAEDSDGDGRADRFDKLFTGFNEGNQQHRCNGFDYGLDNWIYGANGDSGGMIRSAATGRTFNLSGHDFRFRPADGAFELIEGQTQFGRRRDDWGNWFGNANPVWLWHYWLPERYLRRNPRLAVDRLRRETATSPEAGRVLALGRKPPRLNDVGTAGHVTSANSPTPYRDNRFGPGFARAVFISEPVYNAVRCEILEPAGVSFTSQRWQPGEPREFIASSDPWFRPTGLRIGPDGALYVADMYRQFIEHPEWIPDDIRTRYNLRAGEDRGRIYRIRPRDGATRGIPRLDGLAGADLARALDHPNGWQRDTAQRRMVGEQDRTAIPALRQVLADGREPAGRLGALATLDGLAGLQTDDLLRALNDPHPSVREQAVRLTEPLLRAAATNRAALPDALATRLLDHAADPELRVRYQLALSLGEWDDARAAASLASLARRDAANGDVLTAIASSATKRPGELLATLFASDADVTPVERLVRDLVTLLVAGGNDREMDAAVSQLARPAGADGRLAPWQLGALARVLGELERGGRSTAMLPSMQRARPLLVAGARDTVTNAAESVTRRASAVSLLGHDPATASGDARVLAGLLGSQHPDPLPRLALARLGQLRDPAVATAMLDVWGACTPAVRAQALDLLLRREVWATQLLARLETRSLSQADLTASARQQLLQHPEAAVRARTARTLAVVDATRQTVIDRHLPLVRQATGNATRGAAVFARHCAACHRLQGHGTGAAPDLATLVDRSPERFLVAVLDPSRAVEDRYRNYQVVLKNGDELSGMLAGESANSITLVSAGGIQETLLRRDLTSIQATRASLMPDGFEQLLTPADLADLLAHLEASARPPHRFPGNQPGLITGNAGMPLILPAASAEIHGDGIAFEIQHRNLGFWNGPDSRAAWTLDVPVGGDFEVVLSWACDPNTAGNLCRVSAGEASVVHRVASTGSWDTYRTERIGRLHLAAGRQRIVIEPVAPLRGHLMDLRMLTLTPEPARR